jgi:hypothetical protein
MQSAFQGPARIGPDDLENLRTHWNVPLAALLDRAHALDLLDTGPRNRLWTSARMRGYPAEPGAVPHEETTTLRNMLDCFLRDRGLGIEDLARLFKVGMRDMAAWYGTSIPPTGMAPPPESRGGAVVQPIARKRRAATVART